MAVIDFDTSRVSRYIDAVIDGFFRDPPDSDYQRGFLAALVVIRREATGKTDDRLDAADRMAGG